MLERTRKFKSDMVIELLSSDENEDEQMIASSSSDSEPDSRKLRNKTNVQNNGSKSKINTKAKNTFIKRYKETNENQLTLDSFTSSNSLNNSKSEDEEEASLEVNRKIGQEEVGDKYRDKDEFKGKQVVIPRKDRDVKKQAKEKNDDDENDEHHDEADSSVIEIDEENREELEESSSDAGITHKEQKDEDDDNDDDSDIQVPDSSPHKKSTVRYSSNLDSSPPSKITTKLPSLREKFSFDAKQLNVKPNGISSDYLELRRSFPDFPANVIMSALRSEKTIRNAMRYLKTLKPTESRNSSQESISRPSSRLDSLHSKHDNLALSARLKLRKTAERAVYTSKDAKLLRDQRLKEKAKLIEQKKREKLEYERALARNKAEKENIVSSKVQMNFGKKSLKDKYVTDRVSKRKVIYDEENANDSEEEEEDDDDDDDNSLVELVDSDDSLEEVLIVPSKKSLKRRYEEDDDFEPTTSRSRKKADKLKSKIKTENRSERADRRAIEIQNDDFMLPELDADEDANLNINEKIFKLFNNADIRDIIDLSNMKPEQAALLVSKRPFRSLKEIAKVDLSMGKNSSRSGKTPIERFIDLTGQKLTAYSAIDTLLKQCFEYSKSIRGEIKKWGVNLNGKNLDGELAITDVNIDSDYEVSESDTDSDSDSDAPVAKKKYKKFKIDGSENDDDFSNSSKKKVYKSKIDNSKVKDRVGYFKKKPSLLSDEITLKDYQQVGINWINLLFQKQLSCILADEMGLGKTAQVISFLSHLKRKKYKGPHLIVVPSSTLENWLREFEKFSPSLKIIPYYGSLDEREELRSVLYEDDDYDVILTTYNLATGKIDAPFLQSLNFNVIVYDEGHMLKNATSDRYKKLTRLKANFRLLLTGTPLQNNLKELISLLDFILPEIFDSKLPKLELLFDQKATTKTERDKIEGKTYNPLMSEQAISKAKVMMAPFVLRRTKAQVMKDLPQKHTKIEYCELVLSQSKIYQEELNTIEEIRAEKAKRKLMKEEDVKKLPSISRKSTNILMTLRKACLHPLLFRRLYTDQMLKFMSKLIMKNPAYESANQQFIFEDMQVMTDFELTQLCHTFPNELGKFVLKQNIYEESGKAKKLVEMLTSIIAKGEKVLIFSLFTQMLDILEKILSLHNWKFLRLDGSTAVDTRQTIIDKFYEDKTIPIMLLSTKAGGFGINLVCATHVIIHDQSLNPHDDRQAEDRAHRVGQTKEVQVTRLIVKDSIEENILHMAFNKLQLDNSMMTQNVEDVLLKTVEDLIANKKETDKRVEEDSKSNKSNTEPEENAFEAFETPLSLEMVTENDDEPIEIKSEIIGESNDNAKVKRTRRRKKDINYYDGPNVPVEFLVNDDDHDEEQKKVAKYNKNDANDKEFEPISSIETTPIENKILSLGESLLPPGEIVPINEVKYMLPAKNLKPSDAETSTNNVINSINAFEEVKKQGTGFSKTYENTDENVESNPPLNNQLSSFSQNTVKSTNEGTQDVHYIDDYLKEINKVPEGIDNNPLKFQIYHQQAAAKIIELQNKLHADLLRKVGSTAPVKKPEMELNFEPKLEPQINPVTTLDISCNDPPKMDSTTLNISKQGYIRTDDEAPVIKSLTDIINNFPQ